MPVPRSDSIVTASSLKANDVEKQSTKLRTHSSPSPGLRRCWIGWMFNTQCDVQHGFG